jgi:hypothetical protein
LLSQKTLDVFAQHQVTGYQVRPVRVSFRNRAKTEPPPLYELVVTGWGGTAAPQAGVRLLESCPGCMRRLYSIAEPNRLIDPKAWDGSDIFMVWPLPKYRFVSDRLANLIRGERLTGVDLIPAPEIPMTRGADLGPGGLRLWMPDDRARQIGEPLGIY